MTADNELRSLLDRAAVYDLLYRYCDALDFRRWELLDDVFTPDVKTYWPAGGGPDGLGEMTVEGQQNFIRWIREIFQTMAPTHHMITNLVLDVDGDLASAVCRVRAYHSAEAAGKHLFEESLATFSGSLVRTPQGWRFTEFRETMLAALGDLHELAAHGVKSAD